MIAGPIGPEIVDGRAGKHAVCSLGLERGSQSPVAAISASSRSRAFFGNFAALVPHADKTEADTNATATFVAHP